MALKRGGSTISALSHFTLISNENSSRLIPNSASKNQESSKTTLRYDREELSKLRAAFDIKPSIKRTLVEKDYLVTLSSQGRSYVVEQRNGESVLLRVYYTLSITMPIHPNSCPLMSTGLIRTLPLITTKTTQWNYQVSATQMHDKSTLLKRRISSA